MTDVGTKIQSQNEGQLVKKIAVIIVAAGRGSRAGEGIPKQYRNVAGTPLLRRTLDTIRASLPEAMLLAVIHPDDQELYDQATKAVSVLPPAYGGTTRQISVLNGLTRINELRPDFVLVHDAARPFVSAKLLQRLMMKLEAGSKAVVPAVPIFDTVKRVGNNIIEETVDRSRLFVVQTPQGFCYQSLIEAHANSLSDQMTDDAAVMEAAGHSVEISTGDERNFKVTTEPDFKKAESYIMAELADIRVGSGYDVHRFEAGDHIWLCGVKIPFTKSLAGHSDADVALHAITDALLSSVAAGDIGVHFPPSEKKWRGAASEIFLRKACEIIQSKGGSISHITVCLICEKPKIGPHSSAMQSRVAKMLGITPDRVSIQATTTEGLGFTGREEGIAAQATATVRLPI